MKKLLLVFATWILGLAYASLAQTASEPSEIDVIACTLYKEARGESSEGKKAVASVIFNRAFSQCWQHSKFGSSMKAQCLAKFQFSCHNGGFKMPDPTNALDIDAWKECLEIATSMVEGRFSPNTNATSYLTKKLAKSPKAPSWSKDFNEVIGNHIFGNVAVAVVSTKSTKTSSKSSVKKK